MDFQIPRPAELRAGLRALYTVAAADGAVDDAERAVIAAAAQVLGSGPPPASLEAITPAELAGAITDPQLRMQLTGGLLVMAMADGEVGPAESAAVSAMAAAMGVEESAVRNLGRVARGHHRLARLDILRRQWAPRKIRQLAAQEGAGVYWRSLLGLMRRHNDPAIAQRYRDLERCPAGSLGRAYFDYIGENGFPFPGEPGAAPEVIVFHDMTHILSGYGTTPTEEILAATFSAGYSHHEQLNWLMFVLLQFQLNLQIAPGVEPEFDRMDPVRLIAAMRRGAGMSLDLNESWVYWDVVDEPIAVLRARYNILPESDFLPTG